ncbi:DNA recombination protein RmuC [Pollutimonas thiosulfatoxidans]|uniref:DNA recombination protein RmuC n=1 Tax=Pollutimonas thiosulfatoxidans TaxID=2028345 RepID=A0A410GFN7_9BURK|nr:DNA recombination protein RmuC [Pollutimonas thiosulfatoxidans]QAA95113.1 DNA recombination protein RmuC [Pollutimonas thiosulfatoxidans]
MRGLLIGVDPAASLALAALAGFLVAALIGWRVWAAANRRTAQALAAAALADRELAASEATMHGLHERLDELRAALSVKAAELERMSRQREQAQHELTHLQAVHAEKLAGLDELRAGLQQSRDHLKTEFQNLANQILEEKGRTFAQTSQSSLDALLQPFRQQIQGFQQRVNQVHDETLRGNVTLGSEIRRVLEVGLKMSAEANNLASALKGDKKTTGNWGEVQLERALQLAGLAKGDHYETQAHFRDQGGSSRQPDFVIKLPDDKHLVIDSKVSLVDYDRAVGAQTEEELRVALDAHVKAVRNHIDDLSRKDYSNLIGMHSPSFVLMFMPVEPAYIEAMKHKGDLFDYGYQRNVILVSYTTLMPILKTVGNLWMMARSNEQAHEISARAGDIYNQVVVIAERLKKLGETLATASRHYNSTVTAVAGQQGLYGKASRFSELSSRANKTMPAIEPQHVDLEVQKLDLVLPAEQKETGAELAGSSLASCYKS